MLENEYVLVRSAQGTMWFGVVMRITDNSVMLHNASVIVYYEPKESMGMAALARFGAQGDNKTRVSVPAKFATVKYDEVVTCELEAVKSILSLID